MRRILYADNRPMVVDAPSGKGHVLLFANNPIYRWQTFGEHAMVSSTVGRIAGPSI